MDITIYLPDDLGKWAKDQELNLSRMLRDAVEARENARPPGRRSAPTASSESRSSTRRGNARSHSRVANLARSRTAMMATKPPGLPREARSRSTAA